MLTTDMRRDGRLVDDFQIAVEGRSVRVMASHAPEVAGPPLLLINGMGARLEMWQPFRAALPERRVVMFDLPGISGPAASGFPPSMPGLARWLTALMDALKIEHADVLGYSWGGILAQQLVRVAPQRVRSLVLTSTNFGFGGIPSPSFVPLLNLIPGVASDDPLKLLNTALGGSAETSSAQALINLLNLPNSSLGGYRDQFFALTGWTSLSWLEEIAFPTLVIASDDDALIPRSVSTALARGIPRARLEMVWRGGHLIPINQPTRMAQLVRGFLDHLDVQD